MDLIVAAALAACALIYLPLLSYLIVYGGVTGWVQGWIDMTKKCERDQNRKTQGN